MSSKPLYLGIDASTQSIKGIVIDATLKVHYERTFNFDADLPEYKTEGGVHKHKDGLTVTSPPGMWVKALDKLLAAMKADKVPMDRIAAISGSGQQHGSVWLKGEADTILASLNPSKTLEEQLRNAYSVAASPIWMDSSTRKQCQAREKLMGGAQKVASITGSRAYERFTGNQMAKIYATHPAAYKATAWIALVSSFMPSLFLGKRAPIDVSDGSGMNLMSIRKKSWDKSALACTAPSLEAKLGPVVASHTALGTVSPYHVARYGFSPSCQVIAFSGDNPCSLAGLRLDKTGDIAISMGTSDTIFGSLANPRPSGEEGHIFVNPVQPDAYMAMICYKNGSLTREAVRDEFGGGTWASFNKALKSTKAGNDGQIGFFIREPEITPPIFKTGTYRFSNTGKPVKSFSPEANVRAVVEGQFLSMRLHGSRMGLVPKRILATGGASANPALLQVLADVLGAPVLVGQQANSSSLGAAYRALHGAMCYKQGRFIPFAKAIHGASPFRVAAKPNPRVRKIYEDMLVRYAKLEKRIVG